MKTFAELNLIEPVQRALQDENYVTPTPIQAQTIPPALEGCDVLGCAQTGTGKTAAFALPIISRLGQEKRRAIPRCPKVLILAPTRELAIQIGDSVSTYGKHLKLRQTLVYGGVGQHKQVQDMRRGVHILIATPGRLLDLMNQGHIELSKLEVLVLDEADRMLDMGFLPDLKRIIKVLPDDRQSLFFSATLAPNIIGLSEELLLNPVSVNVTPETTSVERIEQQLYYVEHGQKQELLKSILQQDGTERTLVFTKTKRGANQLSERLVRMGIKATAIHGNKSQNARQKALDAFRQKKVTVLVATDVAARGIDIDGITHVINFDLPMEPENYVHRIGRTGRAGAEGIALTFCSGNERRELRAIQQLIGQKVPLAPGQTAPKNEDRSSRRSGGPKRFGKPMYGAKKSGGRGGKPGGRFNSPKATEESGGSKPQAKRRRPKKQKSNSQSKQPS